MHSVSAPLSTARELLVHWMQSVTAVWAMVSRTMMAVAVAYVTVSKHALIYTHRGILLMLLWYTLPVIGYSEASRDLELDEGQSSTLTVEVIKPARGLPAALLEIAFQIENSANTGMLLLWW